MSYPISSTQTSSLLLNKRLLVPALALLALGIAMVIGVAVGPVYIGPGRVWQALFSHTNDTADIIVRQIRLPRVLVGAMVGASLAMSGAILQGVTRNPLADPQIVGISSGAGLVAVACVVFVPGAARFRAADGCSRRAHRWRDGLPHGVSRRRIARLDSPSQASPSPRC